LRAFAGKIISELATNKYRPTT